MIESCHHFGEREDKRGPLKKRLRVNVLVVRVAEKVHNVHIHMMSDLKDGR